jgi:hypothetical protein
MVAIVLAVVDNVRELLLGYFIPSFPSQRHVIGALSRCHISCLVL